MNEIISCIASGYSMNPIIEAGYKVTVKTKNCKYDINDIVLYIKNDEYILHRIVCIFLCADKFYCITKGDSLNYKDEPILMDSIIGKIIHINKNIS